jgi:hypothetical protein
MEAEAAHRLVAQTNVWLCGGGSGLWLRGLGYTEGRSAASPARQLACSCVQLWVVVLGPSPQPRAGEERLSGIHLGYRMEGSRQTPSRIPLYS